MVNFITMLIGADGAKDSSKMVSHFLRAVNIQGSLFNVQREYGAGETPQERSDEEAPLQAAESEAPVAPINSLFKRGKRQASTKIYKFLCKKYGKFNEYDTINN
ncbi:hypothetical protein [Neobacillus sp. FSL H8-0543]|uniref:hypothetical protein n=1 Tax=Neobacillus sp. FSL H8-0543 TaxID=2954672 RepID=UPI0031596CDC